MSIKILRKRIAIVIATTVSFGLLTAVSANAVAPTAPTNVAVSTRTTSSVTLTFTAAGNVPTGYDYSTDNGTNWTARTDGGAAGTTLVITALSTDGTTAITPGTTYTIKIRGTNNGGVTKGTASSAVTGVAGVAGHAVLGTTASTTASESFDVLDNANLTSVGLVAYTSADLSASSTTTATALASAKLVFSFASDTHSSLVVSGGVVNSASSASAAANALVANDSKSVANITNGDVTNASISPNVAVGGKMTVSVYTGANVTAANPTSGTLAGLWTITIASSSSSGVISAADSTVSQQAAIAKSGTPSGTTAYDTTTAATNGQVGVIYVATSDVYGNAVTTGTLSVTATGGSNVYVGNAAAGAAYSATSSYSSVTNDADGVDYVVVTQPVSNAAGSSTVTITFNGVVLGTKTINWTGDAAKISVTSVEINKTGTTSYRTFKTNVYDAAGNRVVATPVVDGTTLDQNVTNVVAAATSATADTQTGNGVTCASGAKGTTNIKLKLTNTAGTVIYSDPFAVKCADASYTYTAALDKSTYVPGDIATLTITYKDKNGNSPWDGYGTGVGSAADDAWNYANGSNVAPSIAGSNLTAVTAPAAGDYVAGGAVTYKFIVGSTEGAYQLAVGLTGISTDSAKTVPYTIKASTSSVTNAEVLAAIVKLIASINKQIAALQKALKK